jgi:hypothetical protein
MTRQAIITLLSAMVAMGMLAGCNNSNNPTAPVKSNPVDLTWTTLFSEGFESQGDTANWRPNYMITVGDFYPQMRITSDAAHTGAHSITTDSNSTALLYYIDDRIETGAVVAEFYIRANALGQTNFTVELGQNAGSSGGLGKSFGMGFDQTDSVKCTYFDTYTGQNDKMLSRIQINRWYKCAVEVNFTAATISYYLDDAKVKSVPRPTQEMYGIDRLLVFRGVGLNGDGAEGPKSYFADDIVVYKK